MRARERTADGTVASGQTEESTRDSRGDGTRVSRRTVLRASAAAGAAAVGGTALTGRATAQDESLGDWLSGVGNYDGVVDETGQEEVTVEVGVDANGGPYGYGPAAIRVDPGTTVVWEWVEGSHNVVADDGSYESELVGEAGHTFSQTFEAEGVSKYFCRPHETMGMKGAVVVGDVDVEEGSGSDGTGQASEGTGQASDDGSAEQVDFDGWFDGVGNFDGVVDETGASEVTVEVGAQANGGPYGFGPAAVRVDPGTTVTWEWVEGSHNVVADDGSYESELTSEQGFTFSRTFEAEGVSKYFCRPHETMGMKGAVVVGSGGGSTSSDGGGLSSTDAGTLALAGGLVGGLLSPFVAKAFGNSTDA